MFPILKILYVHFLLSDGWVKVCFETNACIATCHSSGFILASARLFDWANMYSGFYSPRVIFTYSFYTCKRFRSVLNTVVLIERTLFCNNSPILKFASWQLGQKGRKIKRSEYFPEYSRISLSHFNLFFLCRLVSIFSMSVSIVSQFISIIVYICKRHVP